MSGIRQITIDLLNRNRAILVFSVTLFSAVITSGCGRSTSDDRERAGVSALSKQRLQQLVDERLNPPQSAGEAHSHAAPELTRCGGCNGSGYFGGAPQECYCIQNAKRMAELQEAIGIEPMPVRPDPSCPACHGGGIWLCPACDGKGVLPVRKAVPHVVPGTFHSPGLPPGPCGRCSGSGLVRCDWPNCVGGRIISLSSGGDEPTICPQCRGSGLVTCPSCGYLHQMLGNYPGTGQ